MQTVNLFDTVYLTLRDDSEIHLTMDNSDIPTDETNIAWRCARALLDAAGSREGVNIRIHKQIPAQAGLGGGSADGAGVLVGLNALLNSPSVGKGPLRPWRQDRRRHSLLPRRWDGGGPRLW